MDLDSGVSQNHHQNQSSSADVAQPEFPDMEERHTHLAHHSVDGPSNPHNNLQVFNARQVDAARISAQNVLKDDTALAAPFDRLDAATVVSNSVIGQDNNSAIDASHVDTCQVNPLQTMPRHNPIKNEGPIFDNRADQSAQLTATCKSLFHCQMIFESVKASSANAIAKAIATESAKIREANYARTQALEASANHLLLERVNSASTFQNKNPTVSHLDPEEIEPKDIERALDSEVQKFNSECSHLLDGLQAILGGSLKNLEDVVESQATSAGLEDLVERLWVNSHAANDAKVSTGGIPAVRLMSRAAASHGEIHRGYDNEYYHP
jgi:hypothetical protein